MLRITKVKKEKIKEAQRQIGEAWCALESARTLLNEAGVRTSLQRHQLRLYAIAMGLDPAIFDGEGSEETEAA